MPLLEKLRVFLDGNGAEYTHTVHSIAYTAREVASAEHLPAREVAKTVVIHGDNGYHMLVLPANRLVDFQEVRDVLGFTHARMVPETELARLFPDCELGAMPPFGNLYGMPVYLDSGMAGDAIDEALGNLGKLNRADTNSVNDGRAKADLGYPAKRGN